MIIQTADGDPLHQICRSSSSSKISLMPHTQNLTNLDGLPIGTTSLAIIVGLLSVFRILKTSVVEVRVEGVGRDGNQAFGSGTASAFAYFHVEDESSFSLVDNKAAPPRRGGFTRGRGMLEATHLIPEVIREEDEVVSMLAAEVASAVQGEDGGIGKRSVFYRSLLRIIYAHKDVPLLSEQSDSRVFGGHFASMVHVGGN
jgi:hypothetical protein